jgi:hypothetical protein
MNAGSVPKTCKSNGEPLELALEVLSGERVSNTWATYLQVRHNPGKPELIPYVLVSYVIRVKIYRLEMGPRRIS